ncbi:sporulation protein YjcZ [Alkalihalobacillus sp. MEB130]|uniref:sporulation protein YjcZ n=1 Tax=Alkalihalobacillus sp. MEB130 TaxID=2976704 RepID=UPI0028DE03A8|nr:sporulation protein YjcZ [Alkalihalobacillus sp. MEB130]MDT8862845.1 sporulation protein YjcZ [Alkalihalobacillus sp. MEB130]
MYYYGMNTDYDYGYGYGYGGQICDYPNDQKWNLDWILILVLFILLIIVGAYFFL